MTSMGIIGNALYPALEIVPERAGSTGIVSGDEVKDRLQLFLELLFVDDFHAWLN